MPAHLSECLTCSRALQQWKSTVRDLAEEDARFIALRTPEEWKAAEEKTLAALRQSRKRGGGLPMRWAVTIAASLLLAALLLPARKAGEKAVRRPATRTAELSAQDQADDALLRDVARLARGESGENLWNALAPEPVAEPPARKPESKS